MACTTRAVACERYVTLQASQRTAGAACKQLQMAAGVHDADNVEELLQCSLHVYVLPQAMVLPDISSVLVRTASASLI